jgi:hypothetical protein
MREWEGGGRYEGNEAPTSSAHTLTAVRVSCRCPAAAALLHVMTAWLREHPSHCRRTSLAEGRVLHKFAVGREHGAACVTRHHLSSERPMSKRLHSGIRMRDPG